MPSSSSAAGDPQHLVWGRPELDSFSSSSGDETFSLYEGTEGDRNQQQRAEASSAHQLLHDGDTSNPSSSASQTESSESQHNDKKAGRMVAWGKDHVKKFYAELKAVAKHTSPTNRTAWDATAKKVEELAHLLESKDQLESEGDEEDEADDSEDENLGEGMWSVGSEHHATGQCRPCHYVFAKSGCTNGAACTFCHFQHPKRFRPRPCRSKRYKCKRLASVLDKVFDNDPDSFQSLVDELSSQGGYLNTVVKSKVRSLQQRAQGPQPLSPARRALKPDDSTLGLSTFVREEGLVASERQHSKLTQEVMPTQKEIEWDAVRAMLGQADKAAGPSMPSASRGVAAEPQRGACQPQKTGGQGSPMADGASVFERGVCVIKAGADRPCLCVRALRNGVMCQAVTVGLLHAELLFAAHMVRSDVFDTNITADLEMWCCTRQAVLDRLECQLLCKQTAGCGAFVYFAASKFCYLGRNHSGVVGTQGAVSGPVACAEDKPSACEDLPKKQFPAETAEGSQSAWPLGFTPTNLQCWPTNMYWQPAFCRSILPTSIENTSTAGHCQDLQRVHIAAERSCAASCAENVLCSAWQVRISEVTATAQTVGLRGAKETAPRGLEDVPSCSERPNFQLAMNAWCGHQTEPFACSKELNNDNPIWDCHQRTGAHCTSGASLCAWPGQVAPPVPAESTGSPPPGIGNATRFVTWNLYIFTLAGRIYPVVDELLRMQPEIAAIPEMWREKFAILDRLNQVSGNVWAFAPGGATEQYNDADILYRSDKWEHVASDLVPFSAGRAINWAVLRRKSDNYTLIASGTHPLCCLGDFVILEAVQFVTNVLHQVQQTHPYPIVLMGDLNTGYFQPSQQLLRHGEADGFGRHWTVPLTFTDAWAELHPGNPDPSTINDDPVRLDYVYFQKTPLSMGASVSASQASLEECFQGVGKDCFGSAAEASIADAGRFQHGVYRVLADLTGVELEGLSLMFGTVSVPAVSQEQAVHRCANLCLSILACQAWQYSTSQGCYIEDPSQEMPYPPVIRKGTELAKTAVAGQYIQHVCPGQMSHLRGDQPKPKHPEPEAPKVVFVDADAAAPQIQSPDGEIEDAVIRTVQATTQRETTAVPAGVSALTPPTTPAVRTSAILPVNSTPGAGVAEANPTTLPIPAVSSLPDGLAKVVTVPPSSVSIAPAVAAPAAVSTAAAAPTAQPIAALPSAPTGEPVLVVAKNGASETRYRESGLSGQGNMLVSEPAQRLEHHAEWPFVIFGILGLILVCAGAHALRVYGNKKANYYCVDPEESDDSLLHG
ncbi:unnamed protein product [Symbiodinium necroappetens]|uniref:C3H1-type domain-containing protein n=1 Tax=Symbiodinium necroappetens TaxID=1628268 RepID=A0A813CDV9_9DINO|nr:unnamed protein product [Symbiodinium necroappetens]